MSTVIIALLLILIVIYAFKNSKQHFKGEGGCCGGSTDIKIEKKRLRHPIIGTKKIEISGMHCQNCISRITQIIQSYKGVSVEVRLKEKCAIISYDQEVNIQDICIDIENAGYKVISVKDHIIL